MAKYRCRLMLAAMCALIFLTACEHPLAPKNGFFFMGELNGVTWRGDSDAELYKDGRLVIWGLRHYSPGNLDDMVIVVEFRGVGKYSIMPQNAFLRYNYSYDMGYLRGISFGSDDDQLMITKYDASERIIEGKVYFELKGVNGHKNMTFNGRFRAKVRDGY